MKKVYTGNTTPPHHIAAIRECIDTGLDMEFFDDVQGMFIFNGHLHVIMTSSDNGVTTDVGNIAVRDNVQDGFMDSCFMKEVLDEVKAANTHMRISLRQVQSIQRSLECIGGGSNHTAKHKINQILENLEKL
ncbi:hypothetical protein [Vibrio phage BX-1]|nr:hypothetical protein [Vibrio phage BX-1]